MAYHCIKYARIRVGENPYSRIFYAVRVSQNPYSRMFYAVWVSQNPYSRIFYAMWVSQNSYSRIFYAVWVSQNPYFRIFCAVWFCQNPYSRIFYVVYFKHLWWNCLRKWSTTFSRCICACSLLSFSWIKIWVNIIYLIDRFIFKNPAKFRK